MDGRNDGDAPGPRRDRRSPAGRGRVDDEAAVGDRVSSDGLLQQPVEEKAATSRAASIESEGEFVEVRVEVLAADTPLVGAQQPALQQTRYAVHTILYG